MGEFDELALNQPDFRRIPRHPRLLRRFRVAASLIEIDGEGWVRRQVDLAVDRRPLAVMNGDPPPSFSWQLTDAPRGLGFPPGSREYEWYWRQRESSSVPRSEFEEVYARAEAGKPNSFRETRAWRLLSRVAGPFVGPALLLFMVVALPVAPVVFFIRAAVTRLCRASAWLARRLAAGIRFRAS